MAKSSKQISPLEQYGPAKLIISKEDFKKTIQERIDIGNNLYNEQINNPNELKELKQKHSEWHEWNKEYLRVSFNYTDNTYLGEYDSCKVYFASMNSSLGYHIQDEKETIEFKINRLKDLLSKSDLIPIDNKITIKEEQINHTDNIISIMRGFHKCAQELRFRHSNRETIFINDEYDVQDLLRSILKIFYSDVRAEDYAPSNGGGNSRIDLVLPDENIIIETKMASDKLKDKELGEQIAIDIVRYKNHPNYKTMIVFIYDKGDCVRNKQGLIKDLEGQSGNGKKIIVAINPE